MEEFEDCEACINGYKVKGKIYISEYFSNILDEWINMDKTYQQEVNEYIESLNTIWSNMNK